MSSECGIVCMLKGQMMSFDTISGFSVVLESTNLSLKMPDGDVHTMGHEAIVEGARWSMLPLENV